MGLAAGLGADMSRLLATLILAGCTYIGTGIGIGTGAWAETRALIAAGLGGTDEYELEFQRHANRLANRLKEVSDDVTVLLGDTADTRDRSHRPGGIERPARAG